MRVLLDACVPKGLGKTLLGHDVRTAPEMGWGDLDNGDLLDAMEGQFDALVTVDKRLPQQQHLRGRPFRVVVYVPSRTVSQTLCPWWTIFLRRSRNSTPAKPRK